MRLSDHGEIIELVENYALVDNKWVNKLKLIPDENQSNTFYGMAIGDGFVVVGGRNDLSTTNGTDRFVVYVWPL